MRCIGVTRPGGFTITDEAVRLCGFKTGAKIADIGCGYGDTAKHLAECFGFDVVGIDSDTCVVPQQSGEGYRFVQADAHHLPFADASLDGLTFECSFSKMDDPDAVLSEAHRVLKTSGRIAVSDFFAEGTETVCCGMLGRLESAEHTKKRFAAAGFSVEHCADFSDKMNELFGQMILDHGLEKLCSMLGGTREAVNAAKPVYRLFVAVKIDE